MPVRFEAAALDRRTTWLAAAAFTASGIALLLVFGNAFELALYTIAAILGFAGLGACIYYGLHRRFRLAGASAGAFLLGSGLAVHDFTPVGLLIHLSVAGACLLVGSFLAVVAWRLP